MTIDLDDIILILKTLITEMNETDKAIDEDILHYRERGLKIDLDYVRDSVYPYSTLEMLFTILYDSHRKMMEMCEFLRSYPMIALHVTENVLNKVDTQNDKHYQEIFETMLTEIEVGY